MRYLVAVILTLTIIVSLAVICCVPPLDTFPPELAEFFADLKLDIPIRAGMTVDQVKAYVDANNQRVDDLDRKPPDHLGPPLFSRPELHLYVFSEMQGWAPPDGHSLTYLANGRHQFWMDLAIQDGVVKNIYIAPGNLSVIIPAFLFDGTGKHVGMLAQEEYGWFRSHE